MLTIGSRLEELAYHRPDAVFSTFLHGDGSERITFGDLYARAALYARTFASMRVSRGDVVIIILKHTPHLFYSFLGAILAGAVPSFMPFPSPKQRPDLYWRDHRALFERIQPRLIVTYEENLAAMKAALPGFDIPVLVAGESILRRSIPDCGQAQDDKPIAGDEHGLGFAGGVDDLACLQHSSGTTGLKKGVMLTHRAILDEVQTYARTIGFTQRDSIASWLPLYHDMGFIACFMTSVLLGTHLVALDPFEWVMRPTLLLDAIQEYKTSFTWLPNFAFTHIVNAARRGATWDLSSVRAFINCSEPCKAATFDKFFERFRECGVARESLHVCYAMAENVFAVTQTALGRAVNVLSSPENALPVLSCGPPVEGVQVEIRDGEICLRSPFMFDGYYKMPAKTAQRIRDGWYYTGDMGFVRAGELYVTGRIDDMLIVNGRNYYAHEIEDLVSGVTGTNPGRNIAIGISDERTDATVVVVLAELRPEADDAATGAQIRKIILETLGLAVHSVVPLNNGELVKTTSGKISRSKNKELYVNGTLAARGGRDAR